MDREPADPAGAAGEAAVLPMESEVRMASSVNDFVLLSIQIKIPC